jgi:hypothetical protein
MFSGNPGQTVSHPALLGKPIQAGNRKSTKSKALKKKTVKESSKGE